MIDAIVILFALLGLTTVAVWATSGALSLVRSMIARAKREAVHGLEPAGPLRLIYTQQELFAAAAQDAREFVDEVVDLAGGFPLERYQTAALLQLVAASPEVKSISVDSGELASLARAVGDIEPR